MATHYVARELIALGHDVRQVPPAYARPFRQAHKNDFRDAYAIAEAVQRPSTRFVPVKTDDQLDLQALHRVRSHLISERTAVINQIRSFLLERGNPAKLGARKLAELLITEAAGNRRLKQTLNLATSTQDGPAAFGAILRRRSHRELAVGYHGTISRVSDARWT